MVPAAIDMVGGLALGGKGRLNQLLSIKGKLNLYTYPYKQYFI